MRRLFATVLRLLLGMAIFVRFDQTIECSVARRVGCDVVLLFRHGVVCVYRYGRWVVAILIEDHRGKGITRTIHRGAG